MNDVCVWTQDHNDEFNIYETSCGGLFEFIDGSPSENKLNFCCYCGKKLVEKVRPIVENDEDEEPKP